jgi:predicted AAA+ superfamily ATPase
VLKNKMAEEIKEKIYKFLCDNVGNKFSQKELSRKTKISYPSVLKWVAVLIAENRNPKIKVEDYGSLKSIYAEEDLKNEKRN